MEEEQPYLHQISKRKDEESRCPCHPASSTEQRNKERMKQEELFAAEAEKAFATNLNLFGNEVDFTFMMMYSIGAILLFLVLNLISYKFSSKRKD